MEEVSKYSQHQVIKCSKVDIRLILKIDIKVDMKQLTENELSLKSK